jgi:hypothetical protein
MSLSFATGVGPSFSLELANAAHLPLPLRAHRVVMLLVAVNPEGGRRAGMARISPPATATEVMDLPASAYGIRRGVAHTLESKV